MKFWLNFKAYVIDRWFIKNPVLRRFMTLMLYGKKDIEVRLCGAQLTINSMRENGYLRAFRRTQSSSLWRDEIGSLLSLFAILRPGDLFLDVGANIGVFACVVARLPGIEVLAFEAHPDTFVRLLRNSQRAGFKAEKVAVSDKKGTMAFVDGVVSHVFAASEHRNDYHIGPAIAVESNTLDNLVMSKKPIVMKIDVEDHECEVLRGAARLLGEGLVQALLLDASQEARKAVALLEGQGFMLRDAHTLREVIQTTQAFLLLSPERTRLTGFVKSESSVQRFPEVVLS